MKDTTDTTPDTTDSTPTADRATDDEPDPTNWAVEYDVEPIRMRDPAAEALAVLDPGDPLVITYADVVKIAGHSCPTAAGAFRIADAGLDALYPNDLPVRGDVAVTAGGPRDDPSYGVTSRLISYITGAAGVEGFGGLAGGHGGRRNLLSFDEFDGDGLVFEFRRTDTDETVRVTYHVAAIPPSGPGTSHLSKLIDGSATDEEREAFATDWHGRVQAILSGERYVSVERC